MTIFTGMLKYVNVHTDHGETYPRCVHDDIPSGKWLLPGTCTLTMPKALEGNYVMENLYAPLPMHG